MRLGFIPDRPFVYDKLTGVEFLRFVAALYGQEGAAVERRIAELLDVFELVSWKDELVEAYSQDRKSTRLNSSHGYISYAVFCLKKKKKTKRDMLQMSVSQT